LPGRLLPGLFGDSPGTGVLRPGTAPLHLPLVPVRRAAPRAVPCGARAMCRRKSRSNGSDFCKKGYGCRRLPCFSEWIFGAGRCLYRNCNGLFTVAGPGCRARYPFVFCGPFLRSSQSGASLLQEKTYFCGAVSVRRIRFRMCGMRLRVVCLPVSGWGGFPPAAGSAWSLAQSRSPEWLLCRASKIVNYAQATL